jgi:hypothetical protein
MSLATPFFKSFRNLLFGKPPVSALRKAVADLPKISSLTELRQLFGSFFPAAILARKRSGENSGNRIFSLEVVFWAFLDQVNSPGCSCRETVRKIMAWRRLRNRQGATGDMSGNTSAYCQARARLPIDTIKDIHTHLAERLVRNTLTKDLWHGRQVKLVDGTGLSMPDTPKNQAAYPQSSSQKPGCGFPAVNLVGIFCLISGALLKVAYGDRRTHETMLFKSLWHTIEKGDVIVADRGYCSFGAIANLVARGADIVMRLPTLSMQSLGSKLPKSENFDIRTIWHKPSGRPKTISPEDFAALPQSMPVRVVSYSLSRHGFRTQSVTLVTTILDPAITAEDLAAIYFRRWEVELHFREIKTVLKMDVLRTLSPEMIERELLLHVVSYNLIRCVMQQAALAHDGELGRISFKGCLDTVRHFANATHAAEGKPRTLKALIEEMLLAIAKDRVPHRPTRSEPRAIKRRPKNFHFVTKPRHEIGNLPHRNKGYSKSPKLALS